MGIMRNRRKLRYLKKYLIYYLVIVTVPMAVVIYSYLDSYQTAFETARDNQLKSLSNSASLCDTYLRGAQDLAYQIASNYTIRQYAQEVPPSNENAVIADLYRLQQMVAPYFTTNQYLSEIQVCFPRSGTIITNRVTYNRLPYYYEAYYEDSFSSYAAWYDWYFSSSSEGFGEISLPYNSVTANYVFFKRNFSEFTDGTSAGVYILLDPAQLTASLDAVQKGKTFFVSDTAVFGASAGEARAFREEYADQIADSSGYFFADIENERCLVTYQRSAHLDGVYFSRIAESDIVESLRGIRILFIVIVTLTIAAGLGLAVLFAVKTSAPWLGLARLLEDTGNGGEEPSTDYINGRIQEIMKHNKTLAVQAEEWRPAVRSALFHRLLFGGFHDAEEAMEAFERIGIRLDGRFFAVILLTINEIEGSSALQELNAYQVVINEYLSRTLPDLKGIYAVDVANEALVLVSQEENYVTFVDQLEKQFRAISRYAQDEWELSISFSGSLVDAIDRIPACYFEAKTAQGYEVKLNNMSIAWFKKGKTTEKLSFYYPVTSEMQLTAAVTKGSTEETQRVLLRIAKENEELLADHQDVYLRLLYTMSATVYRVVGDNIELQEQMEDKLDSLSRGLKNGRNLERVFQQIYEIFLDLCRHFTTGLTETQPLYEQILAFIEQNYTDHQLSLSMIAENFHITEIYFSRLFKEKNGKNYSKYVEDLRMAEASRLLEETDLSVQAIAERVGYNSPQSFRRVYKKNFGRTPREK